GSFYQALEPPEAPLCQLDLVAPSRAASFELRAVPPRARYPLALNQLDIWMQEQMHAELATNNVQPATIHGLLDVPRFRRAVEQVIERQSALRMAFDVEDGVPMQR